jgi:hypothetical protein
MQIRLKQHFGRQGLVATLLACGLAAVLQCPPVARGQNDEPVSNEYRLTLFPYYRITTNTTGFGYLGYVNSPEEQYQVYYLGAGASHMLNESVQLWGGLISTYTENENSANQIEVRPFVGTKLFLPNKINWNIYNYTRYEFRNFDNLDTYTWTRYSRIRSRFGVEFPLSSGEKAWQLKTWYGLVDVEPMFRFDHDTFDPLRVRGGIGYVLSSRFVLEFTYTAQFTRPSGSSTLEYTDNIFRMNIKMALGKGVLRRVLRGGDMDD